MSKKPNLFIVGAPKCGTTAWHQYLGHHPDIGFSEKKEPHYFSTDFPNFCWAKSEREYLNLFGKQITKRYVGEASVMYLYSQDAAANIKKFNPDAKILIFIRSYENFLRSYHSQIYLTHDENEKDINRAWDLQTARSLGEEIPNTCREPKFLQYEKVARFGEQIKRFYDAFPVSQIKVILFEEWTRSPAEIHTQIMNFLGLESDGFDEFKIVNAKRANRFRILSRFLHRPPAYMLACAWVVRRMLGADRLNFAARIKKLNNTPKQQHAQFSNQTASMIRESLRSDLEQLEEMLESRLNHWR